jgi:GPH family glycoside/pentoside/hexuronide:cation symporter
MTGQMEAMVENADALAVAKASPGATPGRRLWLTRLGFLLGALGPATGFQVVTVLMLRYMTDSLAISAVLAGSVLALTKIFDAVVDPLIGWASDKTRSRIGRRRPFLIAGTVLLPVSVVLMFNTPQLAPALAAAVIGIFLMLNCAGYSAFTVPYLASAAEITDDYHERSVLMSFRVYGGTLGLMLASTGAPFLLAYWGGGRAAHGHMALVLAPIMLVTLAAAVLLIPEPSHDGARQPKVGLRRRIALAWGNKPFRQVIQAHVGFQIGVGAVMVCTAYFSRQVLHVSDVWLGSFFLAKTVGNLVSVPMWLRVAKRFDKKRAYIASLAAYGLLNLSWLFAGPTEPMVLMFGRMFLIGIAMGGCILLSYSVITDVIRYDTLRTGMRQEGTFSGIVSFVDKAFQAAGVALVGFLLSSMGYVASVHGAHVQQSASAIRAIYIGFSAIPALAALVCIAAMLGYNLKQEDLQPRLN